MLGLKGGLCIKASFESRQRRCNGRNKTPIASRKERNIQQVDDFHSVRALMIQHLIYYIEIRLLVLFSRDPVYIESKLLRGAKGE